MVSPRESAHDAPPFGHGARVYNVIDSRQSYLQDVVVAGLRALQYEEAAANSVHFSYEMVALSPRTCAELNIPISEEDRAKPYVEVSGRKGLGVKIDDLGNTLTLNVRPGPGDDPFITAMISGEQKELKLVENRGGKMESPLVNLLAELRKHPDVKRLVAGLEREVEAGKTTPAAAARRMLEVFHGR